MKKILVFTIGILWANSIFSQGFTWANTYTSNTSVSPISIKVDASGDVYTMGYFNGTVDFDPGPGTFTLNTSSGADVYIAKLNSTGNFLWAKRVGGGNLDVPQKLNLDASNNIYVVGYFNATVDFDPGLGTFNLTSAGGNDAFILKLDVNGNFVWAKKYSGTGSEICTSIEFDSSGNIITTGYYTSASSDFDPGPGVVTLTATGGAQSFVCKLDPAGNFLWVRAFNGGNNNSIDVDVDAAGNIYTAGYFQWIVDFDPGPAVLNYTETGISSDIFVHKLDASGNFVWVKQIGAASNNEYAGYIEVDPSSNVYFSGTFSTTVDFDPGPGTFNMTSAGAYDNYITKLDVGGNFIWAKRWGGTSMDNMRDLVLDAGGNVFTTGDFNLTCDFDPGPGIFNFTTLGANDAFINKLDVNGNFVNANKIGGTGNDIGNCLFIDAALNIYNCGLFTNTVDFDPGPGVANLTGTICSYNLKWAGCVGAPATPGAISGPVTVCQGAANIYSIAPVVGAGSYTWTLPGGWSGTSSTNSISATPGSSGTMSVTASNGCGTSAASTLSVTVNSSPTILVNSGSICSGQSFTLIPSGALTYTFQGGSSIVSPTTNTSYTVIGTNSLGCVSPTFAISNITVNATPTIIVNSGSICSGNSFTIIPGGASTYTFQGGNAVVSPTANNSYTVIGTSTAGCVSQGFATSNVTVNVNPTITVNSGSICSGQSFTLIPSGANTYTFQGGSSVVSPLINSSFTVIGTSTAGCVSSNTAISNITVSPTPTITVSGGAICPGGSFTLNPSGANTYTYSGGGPIVSPTVTTNYSVIGTSTSGCVTNGSVMATITVTNNLNVIITGTNTICSGQMLNLVAGGAATYSWNTGAMTATIAPTPTANTSYSVIGSSGSCSNTAVINITVNPLPIINVSSSTTLLCIGQSATLTASGADTYSWSTGPTASNIVVSPTITTSFAVTGTSSVTGCNATFTFSLFVSSCTGINNLVENNLEFMTFPNPNNGLFNVICSQEIIFGGKIYVYNTLGSVIYSVEIKESKTEINISKESSGIYFVRVVSVKNSLIKKIIKE